MQNNDEIAALLELLLVSTVNQLDCVMKARNTFQVKQPLPKGITNFGLLGELDDAAKCGKHQREILKRLETLIWPPKERKK